MHFGKTLRTEIQKEWRFYAVDYKVLKQTLKQDEASEGAAADSSALSPAFKDELERSLTKLSKFCHEKEAWATEYLKTMEERVEALRLAAAANPTYDLLHSEEEKKECSESESDTDSETDSGSPELVPEDDAEAATADKTAAANAATVKKVFEAVGKSEHFTKYIYAKKSLKTFKRELELLLAFFALNDTAISKILKKHDKKRGTALREQEYSRIVNGEHTYLQGKLLQEMHNFVVELLAETMSLRPALPAGWENRKVYTIGCFDLFHRGHQNVLVSLREFGCYIVAGIHDDASYYKLKKKYTIDNLETRMKNVKPYVDQLYVIPSTDPLPYIKSMVSEQDIASGSCCYARGDDMLNFPGRPWVESVMPVHFVPRTEACSSTLLRTMYHSDSMELRAKAAFAKTRYDGKPIDEEGNVLKLK